MEISVYLSLDCKRHGKKVFSRRVESFVPGDFDFVGALCFLKSVFGDSCIIEFLMV